MDRNKRLSIAFVLLCVPMVRHSYLHNRRIRYLTNNEFSWISQMSHFVSAQLMTILQRQINLQDLQLRISIKYVQRKVSQPVLVQSPI